MMRIAMQRGLRFSSVVLVWVGCWMLGQPQAHGWAKNYQAFRVDVGGTLSYVPGPGSFGVGAFVEPKFNVLDSLAVGLRTEGAGVGGSSISSASNEASFDMRAFVAFLAKCDYYFTNWTVRPFVAAGLGFYYIVGQSLAVTTHGVSLSQGVGSYFGVAPQVGIQLGAFRLAVTYNVIFGAAMEVEQTLGTIDGTRKISQNYLTIDIGGRIGGRRKAPRPPATAQPQQKPVTR